MWVNFSVFLSSPQVGFLRFLHLLSSFDWRNNPLVVNLNNQLTGKHFLTHTPPPSSFLCHTNRPLLTSFYLHTRHTLTSCSYALLFQRSVYLLFTSLSRVAADYTEIKNDFMASRESLPVMFIATPKDKNLSIWTKRAPCVQVSGYTNTSTVLTQHHI